METVKKAALSHKCILISEFTVDKDLSKDHIKIRDIEKISGFPHFLFRLDYNISYFAAIEKSRKSNFTEHYQKYYSDKYTAFNNKSLLLGGTKEIEWLKKFQVEELTEFEKVEPNVSLFHQREELMELKKVKPEILIPDENFESEFIEVCKGFLDYLEAKRADLAISEMKEIKLPIPDRIKHFKQQILAIEATPDVNTSGMKALIKRYQNAIDSLSVNIEPKQIESFHAQPIAKPKPELNVKLITFKNSETIEKIHSELKGYFPKKEAELLKALQGEQLSEILLFPHNQNKFVEVFRRLKYNGFLLNTDTETKNWICRTFQFVKKGFAEPQPFNENTVWNNLNKGKGEPTKRERICITEWLSYKSPKQLEEAAQEEKL